MKAVSIKITLLQPLLAKGLDGDANIGISMDYIPGSVLRGSFIKLSGKRNDIAKDGRDYFFSGKVKFLNAYPLIQIDENNSQRSLPTPISWNKEKDKKEEKDTEIKDFANTQKEENHKGLGKPFFAFGGNNKIILDKPETRLAVHTTRNVEKGRSDENEGAVFRYESIAEGVKFEGAIISQDEILLDEIKRWINGGKEVLLGGSRNAGYGKASIVCSDAEDWQEPQVPIAHEINANNEFTITFLSNGLLRDNNGHFQADLTAENLGLNDGDIEICPKQTFKRAEVVGGFNRKWGLPLPQNISVKSGSVFKLKTNVKIDEVKVKEWLENGIGERTIDGFGRVAVNLSLRDSYKITDEGKEDFSDVSLSSEAKSVADILTKSVVKRRFEAELASKIRKYKIDGKISNSQISRLRLHIREIRRGERNNFDEFFEELKSTASNQLERVKVIELPENNNQGNLKNWITTVFTNQNILSKQNISLGDSNKSKADSDQFKKEFHLRLIDAVLAKKAKESGNDD